MCRTDSIAINIERNIVEKYEPASFKGLILRSQLLALLHHKVFGDRDEVIPHEKMIEFYPKGLNHNTLTVSRI